IITTSTPHAFISGQIVLYTNGGTNIGGLTNLQKYAVIVVSPTQVKLMNAGTIADTIYGGNATVDLTLGTLTGTSSPLPIAQGATAGQPDVANEIITTTVPHGFVTGQFVTYNNPGGSAIAGLVDGVTYQALVLTTTTLKLTAQVDLTNAGSGTSSISGVG